MHRFTRVSRKIHLDDIIRTLIAYLESEGAQPGYPRCRHSIQKTCRSARLRPRPTDAEPAYSTVWNRLDKALNGSRLPGGNRAVPAVSLDPLLDDLIIHSIEGLMTQFPPRPAELRSMKDVPPKDRRYVYLSKCWGGRPRGLVNVVHVIRDSDYRCNGQVDGGSVPEQKPGNVMHAHARVTAGNTDRMSVPNTPMMTTAPPRNRRSGSR